MPARWRRFRKVSVAALLGAFLALPAVAAAGTAGQAVDPALLERVRAWRAAHARCSAVAMRPSKKSTDCCRAC